MVAALVEVVGEVVGMGPGEPGPGGIMDAGGGRAGGCEAGEAAGLLLPDLELVEREQPAGASHLVGVEPELPIDDPFDRAAGAVADEDRDVGEQDRMVVHVGGLLVELGRRVAVVALLDAVVLELSEGVEDAGAGIARLIREDRAIDGAAGARDRKIDRSRSHGCPSVWLCGSLRRTVCAV